VYSLRRCLLTDRVYYSFFNDFFFVSETKKQWVMISMYVYFQFFLFGLLLIGIGVVINVLIIRHGNSCECILFTIVFSDVTR
jgi:hypothetical protein